MFTLAVATSLVKAAISITPCPWRYNKWDDASTLNGARTGIGRVLRLLRGTLMVAVVTAICYRTQLHDASAALLLLIAVVLHSLDCSFREAAAISVLATLCLDYFFTDPLFSFMVAGPLDAITLVCMLTVTLVITRIQSRSRAEARESQLQRANMESLYKVSQDLLAQASPTAVGPKLLEPLLSAFGVAAVCLFDAATLECYEAGVSRSGLKDRTREGFISGGMSRTAKPAPLYSACG